MKGILGTKVGMTQVFTKDGKLIPVTVVYVEPNVVTQIKTKEKDGYEAVQLANQTVRPKVSNKAKTGHTNKANTTPKRFLREIRGVDVGAYELGQELKADTFERGAVVDVTGTSKGKGFQGPIKRHNYSRGPMSHGSHFHRSVGSLGSMRPKRVFKGKKNAGHMGHERVTVQNLEIVDFDLEENIILVKGNVPGPKKGLIIITTAVKKPGVVKEADELLVYELDENEEIVEEIISAPEEVVEDTTAQAPVEEANEEVVEEVEATEESEESSEA